MESMKSEFVEYLKGSEGEGEPKKENRVIKHACESDNDHKSDINKIITESKSQLSIYLNRACAGSPK